MANLYIRDSLLIHRVKLHPSKLKQEPMQCLKCRKWGHFASHCPATKDTCGTCGGDHWTNSCTELTKRYCAPCNTFTHASWDRLCPEFLKQCIQFDESHPENALKYFPTEEPWTKVIRPPKFTYDERFPVHFVVGSLPSPTQDKQRESPTRTVRPRWKRRTPSCVVGQTAITNYYGPTRSQSRNERPKSTTNEEGKVLDYLVPSSMSTFSFEQGNNDQHSGWN